MKRITILFVCLAFLAPFLMSNTPNSDEAQAQYYDNAKVLRMKFAEGETYVKRSYDDAMEEGTINLPIFEKDTAGTTDGRIEIYLGRLNYLRLDYDTEVVFDTVPELRKTNLALKVNHGGIYLDIDAMDYERDIEIQTPDCGVFLLDKGSYRINVTEGGRTEVYVYEGVAEVAGDGYSRNVRENQKITMLDGSVREKPFYFNANDSDEFDTWNTDRNKLLSSARYTTSRYLENGYEDYEYELSRNGRWRYDSNFRSYVWIPYNVSSDWIPYSYGRWVWNPHYGYVWTDYDSWGFFTHHYGRWQWDPIYHWYWIPGYHWSPAWVSWSWDSDYYCWSPLSWWNRPVIVIHGRWWHDYDYHHKGFPFNSRSTVIIKKHQLGSNVISKIAIRGGEFDANSKRTITFKGNAPHFRPEYNKVTVINDKGKPVVYKDSGIISVNKFKNKIVGPNSNTPVVTPKTIEKKTVIYKYSSPGGDRGDKGDRGDRYDRYSGPGDEPTIKKYKYSSSKPYSDTQPYGPVIKKDSSRIDSPGTKTDSTTVDKVDKRDTEKVDKRDTDPSRYRFKSPDSTPVIKKDTESTQKPKAKERVSTPEPSSEPRFKYHPRNEEPTSTPRTVPKTETPQPGVIKKEKEKDDSYSSYSYRSHQSENSPYASHASSGAADSSSSYYASSSNSNPTSKRYVSHSTSSDSPETYGSRYRSDSDNSGNFPRVTRSETRSSDDNRGSRDNRFSSPVRSIPSPSASPFGRFGSSSGSSHSFGSSASPSHSAPVIKKK
ncbi:MAG: DUF6600 domain-containing protein [Candidatus Omnitrophota bacterium]